MVRNGKSNRRQRQRQPSRQPRRRNRNLSRRTRSVLPPARGMMSNIFRSVVQCAWDIAQGALSANGTTVQASNHPTNIKVDSDFGYLFAQSWRAKYAALFREAKIHKVEAWYLPYASVTNPGLYTFNISDINENTVSSTSGLTNLGAPGTVIRKMSQSSYRVWFPTEPDDRNWFELQSDHRFLTWAICAVETAYWEHASDAKGQPLEKMEYSSIAGKVIINTHASFRGVGDGKTITSKCYCSRCIRIRMRDSDARRSADLTANIESFETLNIPSPSD